MTDIQMYLVGGAVRDGLLNVKTKDMDFAVEVSQDLGLSLKEGFDFMRDHLVDRGFKIFLETPQYLTIRAKFPKGHEHEKISGDFVLCRAEGPYSDSRRPDWVKLGTLAQDLERRDMTINALARAEDGTLIDLFGGVEDLNNRVLRAVGNPLERLLEDPLRAYRALRFAITKGFNIDPELREAMLTVAVLDKMEDVSVERIREELYRCFAHDTQATISLLTFQYPALLGIMSRKGIWLVPSLAKP